MGFPVSTGTAFPRRALVYGVEPGKPYEVGPHEAGTPVLEDRGSGGFSRGRMSKPTRGTSWVQALITGVGIGQGS